MKHRLRITGLDRRDKNRVIRKIFFFVTTKTFSKFRRMKMTYSMFESYSKIERNESNFSNEISPTNSIRRSFKMIIFIEEYKMYPFNK